MYNDYDCLTIHSAHIGSNMISLFIYTLIKQVQECAYKHLLGHI